MKDLRYIVYYVLFAKLIYMVIIAIFLRIIKIDFESYFANTFIVATKSNSSRMSLATPRTIGTLGLVILK